MFQREITWKRARVHSSTLLILTDCRKKYKLSFSFYSCTMSDHLSQLLSPVTVLVLKYKPQ